MGRAARSREGARLPAQCRAERGPLRPTPPQGGRPLRRPPHRRATLGVARVGSRRRGRPRPDRRALRRLPDRQREALALRYYLDLSEAQMAAAMGVSAGSVKTHVHRGLATLARLLEEEDA
ncbi:MAG: sigma factor-like helix-turn-helix DNA-binding protein [Acidimicrobiales bacterium]